MARGCPPCYRRQCGECGFIADADHPFVLHDRRGRRFWIVVDRLVHKISSAVARYVCPECRTRFTDLPDFALPHKRYVHATVFGLSERYSENDLATYRWGTEVGGLAIFHTPDRPNKIDDRSFAPSTLWRWVSFFSELRDTLSRSLEILRSHSPSSDLFRRALFVPSRKYRSEKRRERLERLRLLVHCEHEHRNRLDGSIFPGVATASGFG